MILCFIVTLLHNELRIGLALVVERTETVHGHTLQEYEEKLQLQQMHVRITRIGINIIKTEYFQL